MKIKYAWSTFVVNTLPVVKEILSCILIKYKFSSPYSNISS